jgi:GNAT superfamily N-acetyltransferase
LTVLDGLPADHEAAVRVWHAANVARRLPPSAERMARIWEKLAEPCACLAIGRLAPSGDVVAMALAEPGRAEHGAGTVIPGYGHVSMVFVHPDMWGRGIGRQLLQGPHKSASEEGWSRTTLWTRASNARARRLYEGQGYRRSGHETTLGDGDAILQFERPHTDSRRSVGVDGRGRHKSGPSLERESAEHLLPRTGTGRRW